MKSSGPAYLLAAFCAFSTIALAQQPVVQPSRPQLSAPSPGSNITSVEVHSDHHVTFRLWAPDASTVKLQPEGPEATPGITPDQLAPTYGGFPMVKDGKGVWEATIGPIEPGTYRYNFLVDGVATTDPRNPLTSQSLTASRSLYEVPGSAFTEYSPTIPHGAIATVYYNSSATGGLRRMHIYTPPGYEAGTARLPVLYLFHGGGDSDDSWPTVGRAGAILDNLIATGKAVPMIVAMPAGHISTSFRLMPGMRMGHDAFNDDVVKVILPYIDTHYRTIADRDHRAIAGLSMGGLQALNISLNNSADFAWVGIFSSGWFPDNQKEEDDTDLAQYRNSGMPFKLYWVGAGKYDIALQNSGATVALLNKSGIKTEVHETGGFHAWNNWRDYLKDFATKIFQ